MVVDITGSMSPYIRGVVENLSDFVRYIESTGVHFRLSLIDYRDITCGESTMVHTFDHSVWSTSTEEMIDELNKLRVNGGGDAPETVIDALGYLVDEDTLTFNSDAVKFAVVLTDASYKNNNTHGIRDMDDMIGRLKEKGIRVSVMTSTYSSSSYRDLVAETGGILASVTNFKDTLQEFALSIIKAAEDTEVDTSIVPVSGIAAAGPEAVRPDYAYTYSAVITPENATNKGVIWYSENDSVARVLGAKGSECYVAGVAEGTTKLIAVSADGGYTGSIEITVRADADIADAVSVVTVRDEDAFKMAVGLNKMKTVDYTVGGKVEISEEAQMVIFGAIKGTDKTIQIASADKDRSVLYRWSFRGADITDSDVAMSFDVEIGAEKEEISDIVPEDVDSLGLDFSHSGKLPGRADVTVAVGAAFETDELYLYYYNPETESLELAAEKIAVVDGYATFPLLHCSNYILTSEMLRNLVPVKPKEEETEEEEIKEEIVKLDDKKKSPNTGEGSETVLWAVLFGAGACLTACVYRKKETE